MNFFLKTYICSLFCIYIITCSAKAQELNAQVRVIGMRIQNTNRNPLRALEITIRDFLNGHAWTSSNYHSQERIDCSFLFNVTSWDGGNNFTADVQVQSSRPIYNTSYYSNMFLCMDKGFSFIYTDGQVIDYSDQVYISNLASFLAFYAYLIIGIDKDSFSLYGGNTEYSKALDVCNVARGSTSPSGWSSEDFSQNRYWLVENLTNKSFSPIRAFLYNAHRNGMDLIYEDPKAGRGQILNALSEIKDMNRQRTNFYILYTIFSAKYEELINLFSKSNSFEKKSAFNLLSNIDPVRAEKYLAIVQEK